jgi:hypothetical protein
MYEHVSKKVLPRRQFALRLVRHAGVVFVLLAVSLAVGMTGYRLVAGMTWIDAFLNSAMLMGGMGPVGDLPNDAAKLFAGCYALYAGLVFIVSLSVVIAPIIHRVLHRLHAEGGKG